MSVNQIKKILYDKMGLDANSIGDSALHNALGKRQKSCALHDIAEYTTMLSSSLDELHSFIEEIVVPETWFFRDHEPFKALKNLAIHWHNTHGENNEGISILSLPSSTGEEPYSIAMTLLDTGLKPGQFSIDAIDISHNALQKARMGQYGKNSFRNLENERILDVYFERISDKIHMVKDEVKSCVNFFQGNIFELHRSPVRMQYDVVFCRNLLIYFDQEKKKLAFRQLSERLRKDGALFLGHSECGIVDTSEFRPITHSRSFAFFKSPSSKKTIAAEKTPAPKAVKSKKTPSALPVAPVRDVIKNQPEAASPKNTAIVDLLTQARQQADQGHLEQASRFCDEYIKQNIYDPAGYVLLGLIKAASGDHTEAENLYRKAIYLDPRHHEALIHLSLLLEKQGDIIGADLLKKRISRLSDQAV